MMMVRIINQVIIIIISVISWDRGTGMGKTLNTFIFTEFKPAILKEKKIL